MFDECSDAQHASGTCRMGAADDPLSVVDPDCRVIGCTGLQLLGMGILGEYIRRIFLETKARPTYIVGAIKEPTSSAPWHEAHPHPNVS